MSFAILAGIFLIAIGAFMSGSFAIPFDKVKGWEWEHSWLVFCLFGYVIVPLVTCVCLVPGFDEALSKIPTDTFWIVFGAGCVYGAANLAFGLSLRYLGLALGYALSLGLMMAIGTLVPPAIDGRLAPMFDGQAGFILLGGILLSLVGIGISAYAGVLKGRVQSSRQEKQNFQLGKGLAAALFVGVTGSATALGLEQGRPISDMMRNMGTDPLFVDGPVFLVLYAGSFATTLVWCLGMCLKRGNVLDWVKPAVTRKLSVNYLCCALAGFLWYVNYVFFGMGRSKMGDLSFVAWGILMTLTIVFATIWGIYRGEWKQVGLKATLFMWVGLLVLVVSSFLIGASSGS